jgi:plastin-1
LGVESFIRPENIVTGNARLNLAFCAQIFNTNPGLQITEEELHDMAGLLDDDVGDSREERVFRMWINSLGVEDLYVNNLFEDLRDGVVLLQLMDKIEPGSVSWKSVNRPPKNKYKRVENANYVVVLGKSKVFNFSLVGIGGIDIVDGKKKLILSIVWQLMRYHSLKVLSSLSTNGTLATDRDILTWANERVQGAGKESQMASFRDPSLNDSRFFLDLCSALAPGIINPEIVTPGVTDEEKQSNAKYVISVARKLGACVFLTWEDIVEVKSKMLMTFTASLMAWDQSAPGKAL